jgi:Holliday junction resolvase RusA-like endonuclease
MYEFTISLPPGINSTYKTNKKGSFYTATKVKEWQEEAGWEIKRVWKQRESIASRVRVELDIWYTILGRKKEPDVDAFTKIVHDLLQKQGVITDDKLIKTALQNKELLQTDEKPYITIRVIEL